MDLVDEDYQKSSRMPRALCTPTGGHDVGRMLLAGWEAGRTVIQMTRVALAVRRGAMEVLRGMA